MTGVVTDASGAVIPGTVVVLSNAHTGVTFTSKTDSKGSYRFASVPSAPGYTAVFTHTGFASVTVDNVALNVGTTRTQDAHLDAGTTDTVTVSAAGDEETINTTDATIGNNLDPKVLNELPVQDRTAGITTLFKLQPGVDASSGAVTGARTDQSEVTVDGIDVNDVVAGTTFGIVANAPVDSVEEFHGTVAGMVSSIGTGSGGQFQLVTKSGTNQFHGNLNEYHRDTTTVANDYFNNLAGVPRSPLIRNQFGGNVGGPILKDKLFFFFNFADSRIIQSSVLDQIVPLDGYRAGDVSYNLGGSCPDASRLNTNPSCVGTLSPAQVAALDPQGVGFDPSLLSFLNSRYPHANDLSRGDGLNTGGYRFTTPTPDLSTNYVGRVDYNLTQTQRIFGRFTLNRQDSTNTPIEFPGDPTTHPLSDRSYAYVVSHVWTLGQNKVNQFYYGDTITKLDFATTYNPTGINQYTLGTLGGPYDGGSSQKRRVPVPEVRDDFNWQLGAHNINLGGTFKFIKTNSQLVNDFNFVGVGLGGQTLALDASLRPGNIGAGSAATSDYDSAFTTALGRIGSISSNYNYNSAGTVQAQGNGETRHYRFFETELYAGDTWKVTSRLTLSYGLRYQLYSVPYETTGAESVPFLTNTTGTSNISFDKYFGARVAQSAAGLSNVPFVTYQLGGKANNGPNLYAPSYKDLAPRFAFSYRPSWLDKTVVNGSAGIVYDRTVINAINFIQDQSSYLFQASANNSYGQTDPYASLKTDPRLGANLGIPAPPPAPVIGRPYTPFVSGGQPYGLAANEFNYAVDPTLKDPYSISLNAGIQQELPGHLIMKLNYVGRLGRRLIAQADASQLVDFPDNTPGSGQLMSTAFANLTQQLRGGSNYTNVTAQPWFENVVAPGVGAAYGFPSNTALIAYYYGTLAQRGDMADTIQALAADGFLNNNVGLASQFAGNTFITNKGSSNYNGLLLTLSKNLSRGLQFDFNYTWSHSIDNTSQVANSISSGTGYGFICDATRPRECRGNSDFDVNQEINANFVYDLPFGRGKNFLSTSPRWLDEAIGGWQFSGIPSYRTGLALNVTSNAYVAGYANNAPAIFTGNKNDLKAHVAKVNGSVFQFNNSAVNDFTGPIGLQVGQRNDFRGPGAFNFDAGLAKTFPIIENKLNLKFRADAFNVLNHENFGLPYADITQASTTFGQITATATNFKPRVAQFALRLEF